MKNTKIFALAMFAIIFLFSAVSVSAFNATIEFDGDLVPSSTRDVTFDYHRGAEFTGSIRITANENLTNLRIEIPSALRSEYNIRLNEVATNSHTISELLEGNNTEVTFKGTIPARKDHGRHLIGADALKISADQGATREYNLYYDSPNQLSLDNSRILVNGRTSSSASPLDRIELRIDLRNDFTERVRIEDIDVDIRILDFEDMGRYDFEDYAEIRSIREGRTGTAVFMFDVPFDVYEDRYDIEIEVRGIDENGAVHEITPTFLFDSLDIRRNRNELYLRSMTLSRSALSCENTRTTLDVSLYNIGSRRQEDVSIVVENEELDIFHEIRNIDLESIEYDDRDARAFESFNLNIPQDATPGRYDIDVFAFISGSLNKVGSVELTVRECPTPEEEEEERSQIIVEERPREPIVITPQEPVVEETAESDVMLFLLAGLNLVLIVAVIALLLVVLRKPTKKDKYF